MFGSSMLDIAIGVIFTFLLLSIFATVINEMLAALLAKRGEFLLRGLQAMLNDELGTRDGGNGLTERLYNSGRVFGLYKGNFDANDHSNLPSYIPSSSFASGLIEIVKEMGGDLLADAQTVNQAKKAATDASSAALQAQADAAGLPDGEHALKVEAVRKSSDAQHLAEVAAGLAAGKQDALQAVVAWNASQQEVHVPTPVSPAGGAIAVAAVITPELIRAAGLLALHPRTMKVGKPLAALIYAAAGDAGKLKHGIEAWYDGTMDRVSGAYKARTQKVLAIIGLAIAIALNANTLAIVAQISKDPTLRQSLVAAAGHAPDPKTDTVSGSPGFADRTASARTTFERIDDLGLPLGWQRANLPGYERTPDGPRWAPRSWFGVAGGWLSVLLGWLLTAVAISVGAPFWFDALNRIMVIRSTVKPAEKSPPEKSKS